MSTGDPTRRTVLKIMAAGALLPAGGLLVGQEPPEPLFRISLAEWSFHRMLGAGDLKHLDFARFVREQFDIEAVEYVNGFFKDKATDEAFLADMKKRAADVGVQSLLIMCDGEGSIGHPTESERIKTVENHKKWADAAKILGCHSIRVNAHSEGEYDEQIRLAADGLSRLTEYTAALDINTIVENHGGLSSNGAWLAAVMRRVNHPRCGTLPDFGNFGLGNGKEYDRYKGIEEMMPYAKAVSAKSWWFDETGNHAPFDYRRLMKTVLDANYHGFVGIEYEGDKHSEIDGVRMTRDLLLKVREELKNAVTPVPQ